MWRRRNLKEPASFDKEKDPPPRSNELGEQMSFVGWEQQSQRLGDRESQLAEESG